MKRLILLVLLLLMTTGCVKPQVLYFTIDPECASSGATLAWEVSSNTQHVDIWTSRPPGVSGYDPSATTGNVPVTRSDSAIYWLKATNSYGEAVCEIMVYGQPPTIGWCSSPPCTLSNQPAELSWKVGASDNVTVDWVDIDGNSGTLGQFPSVPHLLSPAVDWPVVSPTVTTTYELTSCNPCGCNSSTVEHTVDPPTPVVTSFDVQSSAQGCELSWEAVNPNPWWWAPYGPNTPVHIDVECVDDSGAVIHTETLALALVDDTTFKLPGGTPTPWQCTFTLRSRNCAQEEVEAVETCQSGKSKSGGLPVVDCSVLPTSVPSGGAQVTVTWTSQDAEKVTLTIGSGLPNQVPLNGSLGVNVTEKTCFTVMGKNQDGSTSTECCVGIHAQPSPPPPPPAPEPPRDEPGPAGEDWHRDGG